jgi:hypothetical protein
LKPMICPLNWKLSINGFLPRKNPAPNLSLDLGVLSFL